MPAQFTNLLDVAIVLAAIYIALSTLSAFINEQIATFAQLRGRKLFLGVVNLVTTRTLANAIFAHAAIDSTVNDKGGIENRPGSPNRPAYVHPHNFAIAFWDELANAVEPLLPAISRANQAVLAAAALPPGNDKTARTSAANDLLAFRQMALANPKGTGVMSDAAHFEDLRQVVESLPVNALKSGALSLLALGLNDYSTLLSATEEWFNRQMGAVQGWYTRQSRYIAVPIALVVVFLTGLDSFEIAQRLYTAPAVVSAYAGKMAGAYGASPGSSPSPGVEQAASGVLNGNEFQQFFHPCLGWPFGDPCLLGGNQELWNANKGRDDAELAAAQVADDEAKGKVTDDGAQISSDGKKLDTAVQKKDRATIRAMRADIEKLLKSYDDDRTTAQTAADALSAAQVADAPYKSIGSHLLGWFVTFIAITLGAPFWYDVANRIVNVRNAGTKPSTDPN